MVYANWVIFMKKVFTIVEEVMHNVVRLSINKSAFTLAEVLVTLGIIGVVAAMTLPMLAKNYQFYVRQQQFKKVYAALDVAIQKTQIDMGEGVKCFYLDYGWNTKNLVECDYFYQELAKNLQILKICEGNAYEKGCLPKEMRSFEEVYLETQGSKEEGLPPSLASGCSGISKDKLETKVRVYMLNSGFTIIPYFVWSVGEGDVHGGGAPIFLVDINAHKGPNKWGHDIFIFQLNKPKTNDSVFSLVPGQGCHALDVGGVYTRDFVEYLYGRTTNY